MLQSKQTALGSQMFGELRPAASLFLSPSCTRLQSALQFSGEAFELTDCVRLPQSVGSGAG